VADDLEAADHALGLGLSMSERHGNCSTCDALLLPVAVSVRVAQNDLEQAELFSQRLDAASNEYGSQMWRAMADQSRAELLSAQGKIEEAIACYKNAQRGFLEAGNQYEATRCEEAQEKLQN